MDIVFQGKKTRAGIIADASGQSCNYFFAPNPQRSFLISVLFDFIKGRLSNECVIPYLCKITQNNEGFVFTAGGPIQWSAQDLFGNFSRDRFENHRVLMLHP